MWFLILTVWLYNCSEVLGLPQTVPWEAQAFYASYKAEWIAERIGTGKYTRVIATTCKHRDSAIPKGSRYFEEVEAAGLQGICSFDEFVRHIGKPDTFWGYTPTIEGGTINPDYMQMEAKFAASRNVDLRVGYTYLLKNLLPTVKWGPKGGFPTVITEVFNALQRARLRAAKFPTGYERFVALLDVEVETAKSWVLIITQLRIADGARHPIEHVTRYLATLGAPAPFALQFKNGQTPRYPSGRQIQGPPRIADFDATIALARANGVDKGKIKALEANIAIFDADPEVIKHVNTIESFQGATNTMAPDVVACPAPTKRRLLTRRREGILEKIHKNQRHLRKLQVRLERYHMVGSMSDTVAF